MMFLSRPAVGKAGLLALALLLEMRAQEPAAPKPPAPKVLVAGENPAIRLLDKEGGKAISSVNFWRATAISGI